MKTQNQVKKAVVIDIRQEEQSRLVTMGEKDFKFNRRKKLSQLTHSSTPRAAVSIIALIALVVLTQMVYIFWQAQPTEAIQINPSQTQQQKILQAGIESSDQSAIRIQQIQQQGEEGINNPGIRGQLIVQQKDPNDAHSSSTNISFLFSKELRESKIRSQITKRKIYASKAIKNYKRNSDPSRQMNASKINSQQFLKAIQKTINTGRPLTQQPIVKASQEQVTQYQEKYGVGQYKELPFCIVVPTYQNIKNFKYFFNFYSILHQNYTSYRTFFIDDASTDGTADEIDLILSTLNKPQQITLVKNQARLGHMANIYNAVHSFCRKGQILMVVDGDDQLIGRNVLKLFNSFYHSRKALSVYSNHLRAIKNAEFYIGTSKPYSEQVKNNNTYRYVEHNYSHLKTTWVDLFLEIKAESLQDAKGLWFSNAVDNAFYFCVLEMSCGEVEYIPELTYKYNMFTGNNVFEQARKTNRAANAAQIRQKQPYCCIKDINADAYSAIKGYTQ